MTKRIVIIMPDGSMPWVDCKAVDRDIFCFTFDGSWSFPVVFDGLGVDYFIVT
jgi:hypothetical protein